MFGMTYIIATNMYLYEYVVESLLSFNTTGRESADLVALTAKHCCFEVFSCFRLYYVVF